MKRYVLILLCAAALLPACKKDGPSTPKQFLLSKVTVDGKPESEFIYNSDGQLTEEKYWNEENGAWQVTSHSLYSYEANGKLKEMLSYNMPENTLSAKYIYTLNANGQISRNSIWDMSGADSGTLNFHIDHEYNATGRLITKIWKDENEDVQTRVHIGLYPNGNMRTSETFYEYGAPEKKWGSSYGPSDTTLPASFYNIKAYPVNYYYNYLLSQYMKHFNYENGSVIGETREEMTKRKYNKHGLVTEQTITRKSIIPAGPDEVRVEKYEYFEF